MASVRRNRAFGVVMCDATWEAAPDAGEEAETSRSTDSTWEQAEMPSFDYESVLLDDRDWHDTTAAIESVRQCLRKTKKVLPLLKQMASRDFFSYYAVNLITPCMYFPDYLGTCEIDRCEVDPVRDRDVPSKLLDRDLHEYGFTIDGWCRKDMPSDFTEYFDLRTCASRDTGYDGSRVWRFIHTKICFSKRLDEPGSSWKRDYNRAVSGMHAAVNAEIVADLGDTEIGRAEFRRRLQDQPGAITNLYFAYMLTLCALHDAQDRLNTCSYLGDGDFVQPLMQQLTGAELLSNAAVQRAANNLRTHAESPGAEVWRMRMRHRDLKQMMGCVQCNLCRVHGTVMCLGLGATMQVLLGSDGRGGDPLALDRVQVAALVATAAKFGAACETVEHFRELDEEDEAKAAWLAGARLGWEAEQKAAWLARHSVWGPQGWDRTLEAAVGSRTPVEDAEATRDEAPDVLLSAEEVAKRAWLAKLDGKGLRLMSGRAPAVEVTKAVHWVQDGELEHILPAEGCALPERPAEVDCDVLIVGGGPAGCTCALYTSRANLTTVVLDKNPAIGALAITSHIANYPGVDATRSGDALLTRMREQAIASGADYRRAQVFLVDVDGDRKSVFTPDATFHARALVLATGAMGRPPSFKGEGELLGKGVSYCATCDGAFYCDREIAVVGVNKEAVEEAEILTKFASTVHWITPIDPKADDEEAQALLSLPNVRHWSKTRVERIDGDASGVTGIRLRPRHGDTGVQQLAVEGVFIYGAGAKPITDFIEEKVALSGNGGVIVDGACATSVQGVYAIGDICDKPHRQAVVAASDGCVAAMNIDHYLRGGDDVRVDWMDT